MFSQSTLINVPFRGSSIVRRAWNLILEVQRSRLELAKSKEKRFSARLTGIHFLHRGEMLWLLIIVFTLQPGAQSRRLLRTDHSKAAARRGSRPT